jgi:hypothetical protein
MGCAYGKGDSVPSRSRRYFKLAGQAFWERVTGDGEFYLKLITLMRDDPERHKIEFKRTWDRAVNRFVIGLAEFCSPEGEIDWERLVKFNSGRRNPS